MRQALTTGQFSSGQSLDSRAEPMRPWGEAVQLESGDLGEKLRWYSIGATRICRFEFSQAVAIRGSVDAPTLVLGERGLRTGGWAVRNDELLSVGAGRRFDLYIPGATVVVFLLGPPVEEQLSHLPDDATELVHRSSAAERASLWSTLTQANDSLAGRQKVEESLSRGIAATLAGGNGTASSARIADGTRGRAVRGALEYIDSHAHESLRLADLCAATGVGARTIEYGFREFYDTAPMTFVKYLRLNRARRDLVRAGAAAPSVKSLAERWGFRHMGQFAKDYKSLFGENPSATRVRSQDRL